MRDLIGSTLRRCGGVYDVVAEVGTAEAAIDCCARFLPNLVILDVHLPDRSGIDAVADMKRLSPSTRILLCTAYASHERFEESLSSGADGFVEKTNTWDEFLDAVHRVSRGERYFSSRPSRDAATPKREALPLTRHAQLQLSRREGEVLRLICNGDTTKEIAQKLSISVPTVETHRAKLMAKFGVRNAAGLVARAFQAGLIEPADNQAPA
jgi:DNA-binding NarL/FixJ family response regulator